MKQLFWIALFAFTLWLPQSKTAVAQPSDVPVVRAVLFMSPTCGHCHYVITELLQPMAEAYGNQLEILTIDVSQPVGSQLYNQAVRTYEIPEERRGVPTLIVGDVILVGSEEIPAQFPELVVDGLAAGGVPWPDFPGLSDVLVAVEKATPVVTPTLAATLSSPAPSNEIAESEDTAVYLAYFYDPTCLECAQVSNELAYLQTEYPNLVVRAYNLREEAALNEALCEKYGIPAEKRLLAPAIFIGSQCLTSGEITQDYLSTLILNPEPAALIPPWEGLEGSQSTAAARLIARFQELGVLAVAGAGLLDGVNPCAFTTIIFFVSYLALVGRKGREILFVGAAFTLAVFLTYLAMGLGLVEVVKQLKSFATIGRIIYGATAVVCLVLAGLSFWDYRRIQRGELTAIALQLPKSLKQRIHSTIRRSSRTAKGYVGAAFVAGVLVSSFELACTGQVYLPTIIFVTGVAEIRSKAIAYLLLYNLMFVVPLLAVFIVTYFGASSKHLTTTFQAHAGAVKLFTAVLFTILGLWLAYVVLAV